MASSTPVLSFAELVKGRDSSVRVLEDGLADLVDLVMVVTGKNCNDSNELLRDLKPSLFDKEKILIMNKRRYVTLLAETCRFIITRNNPAPRRDPPGRP